MASREMKVTRVGAPLTPELKVKVAARLTCPFCDHQRHFMIGHMNGDENTGTPVVVHDMPHCTEFGTMDLLKYMRAARIAGARAALIDDSN
jgi:hypothetical protein